MKNKIIDFKHIEKVSKILKKRKKRIVQCHGVFDLIHFGHLKHFEAAKKFGDVLIVSVTPDKYVNKGINRPFFNFTQRLEALSALEIIDYVVLNNSETAVEIINKIKPNFYCKGPDYKDAKKDVTGNIDAEINAVKKNGGEIKITYQQTFSSSKLLNEFAGILNNVQKKFILKMKSIKMPIDYFRKIENLKKLKVLVIGEAIIDKYIFCEALGKSGKEPHLVLRNIREETYAGGTIAIAKHLSNFCNSITLLSMLGHKKEYEPFIKKNLPKNVKTKFLYKHNSPTIEKKRFIDSVSKSKVLGVYSINDEELTEKDEINFKKLVLKFISNFDVVIVSDYGHGLISKNLAKIICKKSQFLALNAQVNASNIGYHSILKYKNVDCVIINENELRHELRDKNQNIELLIKKLSKFLKVKDLIVTRGKEGAILYNSKEKKIINCPAFASKVVDKVGAGDAMMSILSILLKSKFNKNLSLFLASLAGAQSVETIGNISSVNKIKLLKSAQHILQ